MHWLNGTVAFAPGLLWLAWIHRKDRHHPEPRLLVLRVFALGCLAAFGVLWLRPMLEPWIPEKPHLAGALVDVFLVTAACEEVIKILAFVVGMLFFREFDEPTDGIVYGVAAGLGFASVENVLFMNAGADLAVVPMRAFTATLAHACLSGSLGFWIGLARLGTGRWRGAGLCLFGLALAILSHGLYDLFLFAYPQFMLVALLGVLPALMVVLGMKLRWSQARAVLGTSTPPVPAPSSPPPAVSWRSSRAGGGRRGGACARG